MEPEKPILFSSPMILALLNTRVGSWPQDPIDPGKQTKGVTRRLSKQWLKAKAGTVLWVRETWRTDPCYDNDPPSSIHDNAPIWYAADADTWTGYGKVRQSVGVPKTPETRRKLSEALKGKGRPREVVERWLATKKAQGPSHKQIAASRRVAKLNIGRKHSPESILKSAATRTGMKLTWSPEAREHFRSLHVGKGKPKPLGFGEKIAAAWALRKAAKQQEGVS